MAAHSSPDPLRTLAHEMAREEAERRGSNEQQQSQQQQQAPQQSQYRADARREQQTAHGQADHRHTFAEYRSEFQQQAASSGRQQQHQNADLRALADSMRALNMQGGGGGAYDSQRMPPPHVHQSDDYCPTCNEEDAMSASRRSRPQPSAPHYDSVPATQQRAAYQPSLYVAPQSMAEYAAHPPMSVFSPAASPSRQSVPFGITGGVAPDDSLLYSSQPSRAVLSALRSLQDKLQEVRVEKSALENAAARAEQAAAAREYEQSRAHERALNAQLARQAEVEAQAMRAAKEAREKEERLSAQMRRLEGELAMTRDNLGLREGETKDQRDELRKIRMQLNDAELNLARTVADSSSVSRQSETERALLAEKDMEVARLQQEVRKLSDQLSSSQSHAESTRLAKDHAEQHAQRASEAESEARSQVARLASDLKLVSQDLLGERERSRALQAVKGRVVEYAHSMLNLNYELAIDVGAGAGSARKRAELLQHQHDLLQGLKRMALEEDAEQKGAGAAGAGFASPSRGATIDGVHTSIDEQQYLLAGASSPEAIRVLHPNAYGRSDDSDEDDADHAHSHRSQQEQPQAASSARRAPNTPTVSSTKKSVLSRRHGGPVKASHHHTLQKDGVALPYTIGRSTKQSFSVPVVVQEILAKQPSYYTKAAGNTLAQSKRRASAGPQDDSVLVYPPAPTFAAASSATAPQPVSLAAHSAGLSTVVDHLESEIENLNRDYVHHLDHSSRNGDADKAQLKAKLQQILRAIEKKTKQVDALRQHQAAVQGNRVGRVQPAAARPVPVRSASVKKSSAVTASKRPASAASSHKAASSSVKKRSSLVKFSSDSAATSASSSTDLADRHAHHQHGAQQSAPKRAGFEISADDAAAMVSGGFASPNSQRLLAKKITSMRLLGTFSQLFHAKSGQGEGEAAKRFGSD